MRKVLLVNREGYFLSIDILKGIAIWMIILVHSKQRFNLYPLTEIFNIGQMGCQMFFVVSGFSAMGSYARISQEPRSVWKFYEKRLRTIIPGWYMMILISYLLNTVSIALSGRTIGFASNRQPLSILCNLLLLQGFLPFCNNNVFAGGWFIGTLMILYLTVPFFYRHLMNKNIFWVRYIPWITEVISCALIVGLYFLSRNKYGCAVLENNRFIYFSFINQLGCFLLGVTLFFEKDKENNCLLYAFLHAVILLIVFFSHWKFAYVAAPFIMGLLSYYLLKYMLAIEKRIPDILAKNTIMRILSAYGKNSYYVYLVHALFVWSIPIALKDVLDSIRIHINDNLLYMLLFVPMFALSYYTGLLLDKTLMRLSHINRKLLFYYRSFL